MGGPCAKCFSAKPTIYTIIEEQNMKRIFSVFVLFSLIVNNSFAQTSPDGILSVTVECENGNPTYSVVEFVATDYTLYNIKRKNNHYEANPQTYTFAKDDKNVLAAILNVSNNNVAFQYQILKSNRETMCCLVENEVTGFTMPEGTTTFMCPQMGEMTGFAI